MPDLYFNDNKYRFGTDGRLTYNDTVWDDLRVPINAIKLGGVNDPNYVQFADDTALGDTGTSTGVYLYQFDKAAEEEVFFVCQMPHSWKQGTAIDPHVHWVTTGTDTGNCRWGLEYNVASIGGTFAGTTTIYATQAGGGTAGEHMYADFTDIDMTGHTFSCILVCRLFRDATNTGDTYNEDAALLEFDFHFEKNSLGSEDELAKTP